MFVYSLKRYLPTKLNVITLECGELGYLYVGTKAYNSGVLLTEQVMRTSFEEMEENLRPEGTSIRQSVRDCYDKLPNPLKPLALLLYSTKEEYTEFAKQIGALDIILQAVFPTYYFKTPKEQRIIFEFSRAMEAEYQLDWKEFFDSSIDYDTLLNPPEETEKHPIFVIQASNGVNTPLVSASIENSADEDVVEFDDDDFTDIFNISVNSLEDSGDTSSSSNAVVESTPSTQEESTTTDSEDSMDDIYASLFSTE